MAAAGAAEAAEGSGMSAGSSASFGSGSGLLGAVGNIVSTYMNNQQTKWDYNTGYPEILSDNFNQFKDYYNFESGVLSKSGLDPSLLFLNNSGGMMTPHFDVNSSGSFQPNQLFAGQEGKKYQGGGQFVEDHGWNTFL